MKSCFVAVDVGVEDQHRPARSEQVLGIASLGDFGASIAPHGLPSPVKTRMSTKPNTS